MKILKYIRTGCTSGLILILYRIFYFGRYSRHPEKYPLDHRFEVTRGAAIRILKHFRTDLQFEGLELMEQSFASGRGTLFVSNHNSAFDTLDLMIFSKAHPVHFIAKKELKKTPLLGKPIMSIDGLFLDRDEPRQAIEIIRKATEYLQAGEVVAVYPEGTRNKDPLNTGIAELHPGSLKPAVRSGCNIVVVSSFGAFRYLEPQTNYRSNLIQVKFSKLITPEEIEGKSTKEIAEMCHEILQKDIEEMQEKDRQYLAEGKHKRFSKNKWWKLPLFQKLRKE